jgi:hypothetical protein
VNEAPEPCKRADVTQEGNNNLIFFVDSKKSESFQVHNLTLLVQHVNLTFEMFAVIQEDVVYFMA